MAERKIELDRRYTVLPAAVAKLEARAEGDDKEYPNISGYAAVFYDATDPGTQYDFWGDGTYLERIMPGAFDRALREDDVAALYNHNPDHLLGRSSADPATLKLSVDKRGLKYWIDPPENQLGKQVTMSIQRGDLKGSSFAFVITDQTIREEQSGEVFIREITGVELWDVGPVTYPAYSGTTTGLSERCKRELAEFRSRRGFDGKSALERARLRMAERALAGR